jgi:hypothetical protein
MQDGNFARKSFLWRSCTEAALGAARQTAMKLGGAQARCDSRALVGPVGSKPLQREARQGGWYPSLWRLALCQTGTLAAQDSTGHGSIAVADCESRRSEASLVSFRPERNIAMGRRRCCLTLLAGPLSGAVARLRDEFHGPRANQHGKHALIYIIGSLRVFDKACPNCAGGGRSAAAACRQDGVRSESV